jgi:hypothetical protein
MFANAVRDVNSSRVAPSVKTVSSVNKRWWDDAISNIRNIFANERNFSAGY